MGRSKDLATGNSAAYVETAGDTMTGNLLLGSNSIGLGTTSPDEKLHVEGSILVDAFNAGNETGIFFREGFTSSNKYNHSILAYDTDGSPDGISINGYSGVSICTGSNSRQERFKVDSSGRMTTPNQPSFYAYPSVASFNTPVSSWDTVAFNTVGWDVGSNYNGSNYRFTAPVSGKYLITWMLQLENANQPTWIYAYPIVNGSRSTDRSKGKSFADFKVTPNYHTENGAWIMNLAANDYVTFDIHTSGSSKALKGESHWSGILLG